MSILKSLSWMILASVFLMDCSSLSEGPGDYQSTIMWMDQPAEAWNEATPVGNGRLGGMIFGGIMHEKIQTNEDTFWSGCAKRCSKSFCCEYLPEIRKLIFDDKTRRGTEIIDEKLLGPYNECYMPLADI